MNRNCIAERAGALALAFGFLDSACGKPTNSGPGADTTGGEDTGGGVLTDNPCDTDVQEQLSHLSTSAGGAAQDPSCVDGEGNFLVAPDVGGHAGLDACRPWVPPGQQLSDCPIGEKCMPLDGDLDRVWDSTACVALATSPLPLGAACTPPDPADPESDLCDAGLLCWAEYAIQWVELDNHSLFHNHTSGFHVRAGEKAWAQEAGRLDRIRTGVVEYILDQ